MKCVQNQSEWTEDTFLRPNSQDWLIFSKLSEQRRPLRLLELGKRKWKKLTQRA